MEACGEATRQFLGGVHGAVQVGVAPRVFVQSGGSVDAGGGGQVHLIFGCVAADSWGHAGGGRIGAGRCDATGQGVRELGLHQVPNATLSLAVEGRRRQVAVVTAGGSVGRVGHRTSLEVEAP